MSDIGRQLLCRLPFPVRSASCDIIAATVYWPLARASAVLDKIGLAADRVPLSAYRHRSFYSMRTDALDRFGTKLEKRFTREQMRSMMEKAGLNSIAFSDTVFWCATGRRVR